MEGTERAHSEEDSPCPIQEGHDQAVDESSDVDGDFATLQKMLSQKRRAAKDSPESRLQKALPFITTFSPNIRPLSISDLPSCIALERAAFPKPEHQASPEKFEYRLTVAPELSLGVFLTVVPEQAKQLSIETLPTAKPVETGRADGAVSVLLAHILSTRCRGDVVTDADMAYPKDWHTRGGRAAEDAGHQEDGRTVGLHSLAVLPRLHRCGIGQMIVRAFLDQMKNSGLVDRVALLCQDHLVSYYERSGFKHLGESKAQFGGGGWHDMVGILSSAPETP
ncbi:acyl-CoA N-acyltransferase [Parathielavia appendiculata]|uniref:Acyl-CoA N-acyltransferase n=1 Tax=Parathielavia appendiculata TaxID=2587402 RepID=A0AAN6U5Q6_9PEZI|nr:acyl-CoA N-acyltransferase [Parathielavia appendiculata]